MQNEQSQSFIKAQAYFLKHERAASESHAPLVAKINATLAACLFSGDRDEIHAKEQEFVIAARELRDLIKRNAK